MKKVLIITYYWPPSGGGGVQRWLKMSAYLKENGWEPIIYTPSNPAFDVKDPSLLKDVPQDITVLTQPIFEPIEVFQSAFKLMGKKAPQQKDLLSERNSSLFQRASTYVRGNYFIPDPRITWVRPSVKFLKTYLSENKVDAIVSSGPPHSMHLIAQKVKQFFPEIKWISDFRDPWSEWDLWDMLKTKERARNKHRKLERAVLEQSDLVISISPYHVDRLIHLGAKRCELINNGYDARDFLNAKKVNTNKFIIRHLGSVDDLRDPRPMMFALQSLIEEKSIDVADLAIEFIGPVNNSFRVFVEENHALKNSTAFLPAVPHSEVVGLYTSSTLLLLILAHTEIATGNMPGKMYEYMASGTPILGIGPADGDAAKLIKSTDSGSIIERENVNEIKNMILSHYESWKKGEMKITNKAPDYSRQALTKKFCQLMNELVEN
jgi:glycosyltransferase involved in cell wall biosynthesis